MAKRKRSKCGVTAESKRTLYGHRTKRHGPYIITRWRDNSRLLVQRLPYCSGDDEMRLDILGMPDVLGFTEEKHYLQCAVPHLKQSDYLDKLFCNRRHEIVGMGLCD